MDHLTLHPYNAGTEPYDGSRPTQAVPHKRKILAATFCHTGIPGSQIMLRGDGVRWRKTLYRDDGDNAKGFPVCQGHDPTAVRTRQRAVGKQLVVVMSDVLFLLC